MTQEQEQLKKLSALADDYSQQPHRQRNFLAGAQTILENPGEWGLQDIEDSDERWCEVVDSFKKERDHYRRTLEGLERITAGNPDYEFINYKAKEALKQEDTTCPRCGDPLFNHIGKTCCQGCDYVKGGKQ